MSYNPTAVDMLNIIQAYQNGASIEFRQYCGKWYPKDKDVSFDFINSEYRVAPDPVVCYVNVYEWGVANRIYIHECDAMKNRDVDAYVKTIKLIEEV